ncbi:MmgE/PrpD family protein [Rhodococcus sp. NPDC019627]|uniref:MmgE/PrpD family protein n=1 Tax=unclassified Rhodococcus (in: high G+C Gram-positive bacteria) TaxID=192944 RepID=UPI003400135E
MSIRDGGGPLRQLVVAAAELRFDDLPDDVVATASRNILDTIGVALAGADEPVTEIMRKALTVEGTGCGPSRIWGTTLKKSAIDAATLNGTAAHALDFDDWAPGSGIHPSAPILPAVMAVADEIGSSGADVITAYVAGYEVQERLGLAVGKSHYDLGFHTTGTIGTFGAAAAAAQMYGADPHQMSTALRVAATQAAGLKAMFGSMGKPLHAGRAAAAGILAARLAMNGFVASSDSVLGEQGFVPTHSTGIDEAWLHARFDELWLVRDTRIKRYAACFGTHAAIDAALTLRADPLFDAGTIERIELDIPQICVGVCTIAAPTTALEAKFSIAFVIAAALIHGAAGVEQFTAASLADPAVQRLARVVRLRPNDWMDKTRTDARVFFTGDRLASASADANESWIHLSDSERVVQVRRKFTTLAAPIISYERAAKLADRITNLAHCPDMSTIADDLVPLSGEQ